MRALVWVGAIAVAAVMLVAGLVTSGIIDDLLYPPPEDEERSIYGEVTIDGMYRNISYEDKPILLDNPTYYNQSGMDNQVHTDYYFSVSAPITDYGTQWFKSNLVPYSNQVYDQGQYRLNVSAPRFIIEITNPDGISPDDLNLSTDSDQHLYGGSVYPASYGTSPSSVQLIQVDDNTIRGVLRGQPRQYAQANFGVGKQYVLQEWINDDYMLAIANCGIYFLKDGHYTISSYLASFDYANGTVNRSLAHNVFFSPMAEKDAIVNPSNSPDKVEPFVKTSLDKYGQFGPGPWPYGQSFFGEPSSGTINTWVERKGDSTRIGIMVYFVGLSNDHVFVNASYGGGEPQWTNLYNDGTLGCYGMLMTDQSNIEGDMGWTWRYGGDDSPEYYNISLSVTVYSLGAHDVRFYAYDQDTGQKISDTEVITYAVYGRSNQGDHWMFDNRMSTDTPSIFAPGQTYDFTFEDTCRYSNYNGIVRSVLQIPYAEKVWIVNGDGSKTLLTPGENGYYSFTWQYAGGMSTHSVHLMIQMGVVGGGPYTWSMGHYWVEDVSTGMNMSVMLGEGWSGLSFEVRGPS